MTSVKPQYEAELRYLVSNAAELRNRLTAQGARLRRSYVVKDEWFVPGDIQTYSQHETWLSSGSAIPLRIRTVQQSHRSYTVLEVKRPVIPGRYEVSKEVSVAVEDADSARRVLEELGMRCLITLRKNRETFEIGTTGKCHLDEYVEGSTILELECITEGPGTALPSSLIRLGEVLSNKVAVPLRRSAAIYLMEKELGGH